MLKDRHAEINELGIAIEDRVKCKPRELTEFVQLVRVIRKPLADLETGELKDTYCCLALRGKEEIYFYACHSLAEVFDTYDSIPELNEELENHVVKVKFKVTKIANGMKEKINVFFDEQ